MSDEGTTGSSASWRAALAPGEGHDFSRTPGWWDLRDLGGEEDDVPRFRAALLRALPPLPDGSTVLDVGAGTGTLAAELVRFYPRLHHTLLDANDAALRRAEEKMRAAEPDAAVSLMPASVDPLDLAPLPGGPYRLVVSSIALHDVAPPAAAAEAPGRERHAAAHVSLLRRIYGALEPGGHLIYGHAVRPRFRVMEHLASLSAAGFDEVDCAYARGRLAVCGGRQPTGPVAATLWRR